MENRTLPATRVRRPFRVRFFLPFILVLLVLSLVPAQSYAADEYVEKYWSEMTEEEKGAALDLLKEGKNGFSIPSSVYADGAMRDLNEDLWFSNGILVYGEPFGGTSAFGPRYWGYDINGGYFGNNHFPRDSDSGRPAYVKAWLTVEQIQENPIARGYVGELALDTSVFSVFEKLTTAELWLASHPEWVTAGLDANYILAHFCFNSVVSDTGLTQGQFIGVHRSVSSGNLYYQTFGVEVPMRLFLVPNEDYTPPEPDPDPHPDPTPEPTPEPEPDPTPEPETVTIAANALITGPDTVYVGETAVFTDRSSFSLGGVSYQTKSAYTSFGIPHDWRTTGGMIWEETAAEAHALFQTTGRKTVTLSIGRSASYVKSDGTPVNATLTGSLTAAKNVTVLPVPAANVSLSGPHKANRAEQMVLSVHTHPDRPLSRIELTITDESGGTVLYRAVRDIAGGTETVEGFRIGEALPSDVRVTDGRVKARSLERASGGGAGSIAETWVLPFLTKNGAETTYRYTVTVADAGGYTGTSSGTFRQSPDAAPAASISLADVFYRAETGNRALIEVSDTTPSDGDFVERTWSFAEADASSGSSVPPDAFRILSDRTDPALSDRSFGTGQSVAFDKTGVGRFAVKLTARDVWTEETLPEFVTAADVLTGEAVATSEVANLAPRVSLSMDTGKPVVNLLFLTESEDEQTALEASFPSLSAELRAAGLSPVLGARTASPSPVPQNTFDALSQPVSLVRTIKESEYGFEGAWTFLNFAAANDDYRLYTVTGTFASQGAGGAPASPYTIRAYTAETGELAWTYTLTDAVMPVSTRGNWHGPNARVVTDLAGRYVFFRSGTGKTLALDARTGSFLTVLDVNIGGGVYSTGDTVFFFRRDGLWKIDARSGGISLVESGTFLPKAGQGSSGASDLVNGSSGGIGTAASLDHGRFTAIEVRSGTVYRTLFDPETGNISRTPLTADDGSWTVLAMDAEGKTVLHSAEQARMVVFGADGTEQRRVGVASQPGVCAAATDEYGVCRYVSDGVTIYYSSYFGEGPMGAFVRYAYDLATGKSLSYSAMSGTQIYVHSNNAVFSVSRGGTLYETLGRYWSYIINYGYGAYSEVPIAVSFDFASREAVSDSVSLYGLDATVELGSRSDAWLIARTDDNAASQAANVTTRILREPRTGEQLLSLLENRFLRTDGALNRMLPAASANTASILQLTEESGLIGGEEDDPAAPYLTLRVGEPIGFTVSYSDPESDPSRESHWKYTYSDPSGRNAGWTREYAAPLTSFPKSGRYLLEHWQYDNTGSPAYDLRSNVLRLLIYVTDGEDAPVIPKDLSAGVHHTPEWENNRLAWNARYPDRTRAENVFWAGERLICVAAVEGDVRSVRATLVRADGTEVLPSSASTAVLSPTGRTDGEGVPLYEGVLWDASWINAFGRNGPEPFTVVFRSEFTDDSVLTERIPVVFDTEIDFFRLHRVL